MVGLGRNLDGHDELGATLEFVPSNTKTNLNGDDERRLGEGVVQRMVVAQQPRPAEHTLLPYLATAGGSTDGYGRWAAVANVR